MVPAPWKAKDAFWSPQPRTAYLQASKKFQIVTEGIKIAYEPFNDLKTQSYHNPTDRVSGSCYLLLHCSEETQTKSQACTRAI